MFTDDVGPGDPEALIALGVAGAEASEGVVAGLKSSPTWPGCGETSGPSSLRWSSSAGSNCLLATAMT
ncbi:hypothetical protein T261_08933 [Streptomyces lydicus]|nr:hypothetical protein T261_08933 [Streptomyces lydicus]